MKKNKMWCEKIVLAKAGNEPVEVYRVKARIEGLRKHASQWFDTEDKRYFYWGGDDTARYLYWVKLMEKIRNDPMYQRQTKKILGKSF